MDLDGVRQRLTEGYDRINGMKNSIARIERCRSKLKLQGESIQEDVTSMMNKMAEKLFKLQQSIESTLQKTIEDRERLLDAKKKEIHDGYAHLVQVCVEADKLLKGRSGDILGRSCQRLLSKFELADAKLNFAEKVDTERVLAFEFQDNTKEFLSRTFVARLQHFGRQQAVTEVDEFWVDYQQQPPFLPEDGKHKADCMVSMSGHTNSKPDSQHMSADKNANYSPRQPLDTIHEEPESCSPLIKRNVNDDCLHGLCTSFDVVRIHEKDLCVNNSMFDDCFQSRDPDTSACVRTPPGLPCSSTQAADCLLGSHRNEPKDGTNSSFVVAPAVIPSVPTTSHHYDLQNSRAWLKSVRRDVDFSVEEARDEDDFVWVSDDSDDLPSSDSACRTKGISLLTGGQNGNKHFGKKAKTFSESVNTKSVMPETTEEQPRSLCLDKIKGSLTGRQPQFSNPEIRLDDATTTQTSATESLAITKEKVDASSELPYHIEKLHLAAQMESMCNAQVECKMPGKIKETTKTGKEEEKPMESCIKIKTEPDDGSFEPTSAYTIVKTVSVDLNITTEPLDPESEGTSGARAQEVPRPIKMRSKRLDLSHMLEHAGGSLFEIHAKCVEKIRGHFDHPIGVCTNRKGDVIVADTGNHVIKVLNNGRVIDKFGADLKMRRPSAVVVNEMDEVFVKDDHCLYHFDANGTFIKTMGNRMMNAPYGLGMTKEGNLVVVDALYSNARIHVFDQSGAIDTFPYEPLRGRYSDSKCRFLAVHGENVLTSDLGRSCLYLTDLKGQLIQTLGWRGRHPGELNQPAGIACDAVGNWIVADSKNHRVQVFAQNGYFMATLHFSGESIHRPSDIHLTNDGLLYVINYIDSVIKVFKLGMT